MKELKTTGLFYSTEELIDQVFKMEAQKIDHRSIRRMCGVSEEMIDDILENLTPSKKMKLYILEQKIKDVNKKGESPHELMKMKDKLLGDKMVEQISA